jgi:hypothetical protein
MSKTIILARLRAERRRLEQNLAGLSPEVMVQPGVVKAWSVKDVLAHLAEWEALCLGWVDATRRGDIAAVPAEGETWRNLDPLNQRIYLKHRDRPLEEVLADFHAIHARFVEMVEGMSDDELLAPGYFRWTGRRPFYDWASGYAAHDLWGKTKIRAWRKRQGA